MHHGLGSFDVTNPYSDLHFRCFKILLGELLVGIIEFQKYLLWESAFQIVIFFGLSKLVSLLSPTVLSRPIRNHKERGLTVSDTETKLRHHPVPMIKH